VALLAGLEEVETSASLASSAPRKRKATASSCALQQARNPTVRQEKIAQMLSLAEECGFACTALTEFKTALASAIFKSLVHRQGMSVYQSVAFSIPLFSRGAALAIIGSSGLEKETSICLNWKLKAVQECAQLMAGLTASAPSGYLCDGISRALMSASEPTALVIATILPTLELTWEATPSGDRLRGNFLYCLADADGELHPPKDNDRRELKLSAGLQSTLRARVLFDARAMIARGFPLASGWYSQLGMTQQAAAVSTCEAVGKAPKPVKAQKEKLKKGHANVSHIVKEVKSTGKAKIYFLVEWEGYHPSFELHRISGLVGDPVQTWETLAVMRHTEALVAWRQK
jgi:hypothetical protein